MAVDFNVFRIPSGSWEARGKERKDGLCQVTFNELDWINCRPTGKKLGRIVGDKDNLRTLRNAINDLLNNTVQCDLLSIPIAATHFKAHRGILGGVWKLTMTDDDGTELGRIHGTDYDFHSIYQALKKVYGDE